MKTKLALFMLIISNGYLFAGSASAEFTYKENYDGLYSKETFFGANSQYNNREIWYRVGKNTKIMDISQVKSELGIPEVSVITNPAISTADIPSGRTGDATHGVIAHFYPPNVNSWAEQPFSLDSGALNGRPGLTEFWLQYDIFFPSDYADRSVAGHWGSKSFIFWADRDNYGYPPQFTAGRIDDGSGTGSSRQSGTFKYKGADGSTVPVTVNGSGVYVDTTVDNGHWQRRTFHLKLASGPNRNDGVLELWVKQHNGNIKKLIDVKNNNWYSAGKNYIANGYILGWSNPGFSNSKETILLLDNMILSESISEIDQTAFNKSLQQSSQVMPPNPPGGIN